MSTEGIDLLRDNPRTYGRTASRTPPEPSLFLDFARATALDPRITFSRGSQATLFDSTGTLVYAKHNLVLQSQDFTTTWATSNTTITTNTATAPDGTLTADTLTDGASTNQFFISQSGCTAGVAYTFSVFAKANTLSAITFAGAGIFAAGISPQFDLQNGVTAVVGSGASGVASIQSVGNGWYRCIFSFVAPSTGNIQIHLLDQLYLTPTLSYTGTGNGSVFLWGAQLNLANMEGGVTSSLTTYYPTTTAAYYAPRFDYNPSTLQPLGLLIEEARTNSIRNNTMVGAVAPSTIPTNWASNVGGLTLGVVGTGTENGIAYIDIRFSGTPTATFANVRFDGNTQIVAANGQTWSSAFYARMVAGSTTNIVGVDNRIYYRDNAGTSLQEGGSDFTSTVSATSLSVARRLQTLTGSNASIARINNGVNITTTIGAAIDITLRIGLPQLEQGAFATSVIPTTTTALTRNADVASMTGTNFSSWYNQSASSFYAEVDNRVLGTDKRSFWITDATNTPAYGLRMASNNTFSTAAFNSGTFSAIAPGTVTIGQIKQAGAITTNDVAAVANGGTVGTASSWANFTADKLRIGSDQFGGNVLNGTIRRIAYYPTRLPNTTLQALTA